MSGAGDAVIFLALVAILAGVSIRVGMLVAPRLDRWTAPDEEDDDSQPD